MEWRRRSIRLPHYDYSTPGAYFVTICSYGRQMLFDDKPLHVMIEHQWHGLPQRFPSVHLDGFVIMPNHLHFVIWLTDETTVGAPLAGARGGSAADDTTLYPVSEPPVDSGPSLRAGASPAPTLGDVVGAFKSQVAIDWLSWIKANRPLDSARIWQKNYFERVVRHEDELNRIREYIRMNSLKWEFDHDNPARTEDTAWDREWSWLELGEDKPHA